MAYRLFGNHQRKSHVSKLNYLQVRHQYGGPNYARSILVIATSAVVGALGASVSLSYFFKIY